jgi:hypothetical protein
VRALAAYAISPVAGEIHSGRGAVSLAPGNEIRGDRCEIQQFRIEIPCDLGPITDL